MLCDRGVQVLYPPKLPIWQDGEDGEGGEDGKSGRPDRSPYIGHMFPYRDDNPTLATPVVTVLLIALNLAVCLESGQVLDIGTSAVRWTWPAGAPAPEAVTRPR